MSAPINSQILNGGSSLGPDWAWGWGRSEGSAESTAQATVIKFVVGASVAEATTEGDFDRISGMQGDALPFAESWADATRLAVVSATASADAEISVTAVRTAWMVAKPGVQEAVSQASAVRYAYATGGGVSTALAEIDSSKVVRTTMMYSRGVPGVSQTWAAESHIERLRVRQRSVVGAGVGRAGMRVLPNTWLARGVTHAGAEAWIERDLVWKRVPLRGTATAEASIHIDPEMIRISKGTSIGTAEMRMEPTITREGVRYSYNAVRAEQRARAVAVPVVLRKARPTAAVGICVPGLAHAAMQIDARARGVATARTVSTNRSNTVRWAHGGAQGRAFGTAWNRVTTRGNLFVLEPRSDIQGEFTAIRGMVLADIEPEVAITATARVLRYVDGAPSAEAMVAGEAESRRGRIMGGAVQATSQSVGVGLRFVWAEPAVVAGNGLVMRFVYQINAEVTAPDTRTVFVPFSSRELAVPYSSREYLVR